MAEIKIEKKSSPWVWIIGAILAVAIVAWFLFANTDGAPETNEPETVETELQDTNTSSTDANPRIEAMDATKDQIKANPNAQVTEFAQFVGDKSKMGVDHEYTNEAMIKLVNATIEKAVVAEVNIDTELESAVQKAQLITNDPMDTDHANKIKQAYLSITDVIEKVQKEEFPELSNDVNELRNAAERIDPAVLTLDQKTAVNTYFDEASQVLQKMNTQQ